MKIFLTLIMLVATTSAYSNEVNIKGLKAKALMDTLLSNEKLQIFQDGGMGKIYLTMTNVSCLKNTFPGKEIIACTFHGEDTSTEVKLYSTEDRGMEEIRYVLVEASRNETQTTETMKELSIKKLECKVSGLGHVLDDNDIELKYTCALTL